MEKQCMNKGRISKIGSYAISSSLTDRSSIACTTFNILAPIYKRVKEKDKCGRESDYKAFWLSRNHNILNLLLLERSSIICLQEFWIANEELVHNYEKRLGDAGYITFKLARTNNRGDGLLTAVHKEFLRVLNVRELLFNDFGDRVAQILHVELAGSLSHKEQSNLSQEILIVNTHLLFPHDSSLCLIRLQQVYKILQYLESYQREKKLSAMPIILCGDWNGSKRGHVYKFLRSQGFMSSYDTAHQYTDADAQKWVSHRNHRGNVCGVDFIWLLNPNKYRKLLKHSWREAVFCMFKDLLRRKCETESAAFSFLKADHSDPRITNPCFYAALEKLKLTGHCNGLTEEDTNELWARADTEGKGSLGFDEFKHRIWNSTWCDESESLESKRGAETTGFSVKNAVLFPCEAEKGMWPDNYSLSDHARLTVVFSPITMPCSELIF